MVWKIVLPFIKVVEKRMWLEFPFICKGSLDIFYIRLSESDIKISTIKRLW